MYLLEDPLRRRHILYPVITRGIGSGQKQKYNYDMPIAELAGKKYVSLATFRKSGAAVRTPVWFAEADGKLCFFTNPRSGKVKRIRNNPNVRIAPCTMGGRITGPEFDARARILSEPESNHARTAMKKKYWLMRLPFLWSKDSIFLELEVDRAAS